MRGFPRCPSSTGVVRVTWQPMASSWLMARLFALSGGLGWVVRARVGVETKQCGCAGCDERIVRGCREPVTKSLLRSTTNAWPPELLAKRVDRIRQSMFGPHVVDDHCRRPLLGVLSCTTVTVTIHMHVRYAMPMHCLAVAERQPSPPANT
jgi:hypothetical protein